MRSLKTTTSGCRMQVLVCMYGHTHGKSNDQPGNVANPARGQLNREKMDISLSPYYVPGNLVSRDGFSRPVPRQPAHMPIPRLNLVLTCGISPEFRGGVQLFTYCYMCIVRIFNEEAYY